MQPEEKDVDKSISVQLIEDENDTFRKEIERINLLNKLIREIVRENNITVREWGIVVEAISSLIGNEVSKLELSPIINK